MVGRDDTGLKAGALNRRFFPTVAVWRHMWFDSHARFPTDVWG